MKKDINTQEAITQIRELLSNNSLEDCKAAGDILEDLIAHNAADNCTAMKLCSMIFHGFCSIQEFSWVIDAESTLANIWRIAKYYLIDDGRISDNENADWLIDHLISIQPDNRQVGCIARVRHDFMRFPDAPTRMKILLALQSDCAFAIVNWRGEGLSSRLMYEHLSHSLFEEDDNDDPSRYFHKADEVQTLRGKTAEKLEQELFRAMEPSFGEIEDMHADSWPASSENDRTTISGWNMLCSEETFNQYLDEYGAIHIDGSGCFKYQCPVPGECVIIECLPQSSQGMLEEYIVPAMIDGIQVKRVEHIPDVKSSLLRFEEGIEEISLQGFHGEINKLILPDSLVRIQEGSFQNIPSLREITMNGAVLESCVFAHCVNLERVRFGPKLWSIMDRTFEGCQRLMHVEFPDKIFSIGEDAFSGCAMKMLVLPEMERLKDGAFRKCASLEAVRFTGDIGSLRGDPFTECDSLKQFVDIEKLKG